MKLRNYTLTFNLLKNFLESKIYYGSPKSITKNNFNIYFKNFKRKKNFFFFLLIQALKVGLS